MGEHAAEPEAAQGSAGIEPAPTQAGSPGASGACERKDDGLVEACTEVLERYEKTPGCELVYAGYLDLFGDVWASLVLGPGWVELSVVRADGDGSARTSVSHIDSPFPQALDGDAS